MFDLGLSYNASLKSLALPIALIQRRNMGIFHMTFNPEGCARAYVDGKAVMSYKAPDGTINSKADCFNHTLIATIDITDPTNASRLSNLDDGSDDADKYKQTGLIESKMSGRFDGLYVDEINERDVEDLRMSAHDRNHEELMDEAVKKAVAGEIRGKEKLLKTIHLSTDDAYVHTDNSYYKEINLGSFNNPNIANKGSYNSPIAIGIIITKTGKISKFSEFRNNPGRLYINSGLFPSDWSSSDYEGHLDIFLFVSKSDLYNNTLTYTDIIGDPRRLSERVKLVVADDATVDLTKNEYVKCNKDDNNGGTAGHFYRLLGADIAGIHTNSTDGDANAAAGHIDFSDDAVWIDLGTDGSMGGYKQEWLNHGINANPLIVGEKGESLLPVDSHLVTISYANNTGRCSNTKLSRTFASYSGVKSVVVIDPNSDTVKSYRSAPGSANGNDGESWAVGMDEGHVNSQGSNFKKNTIILDWDQMEDIVKNALDFAIILVTYEPRARCLSSNADKYAPALFYKNEAYLTACHNGNYSHMRLIAEDLVSRCLTNTDYTYIAQHLPFTIYGKHDHNRSLSGDGWAPLITHTAPTNIADTDVVVKMVPYLTETNSVAKLQFVFKEMKFDGTDWGDDNQFQIVSGVSTVTNDNDEKVLVGQKSVKLPYFIK